VPPDAEPLKLSELPLATTPLTVPAPPAAAVPEVEEPPLPPSASKLAFTTLAVVPVYGVPVVPSVELAAPPTPAVDVSESPPAPP